ncbi:hypothetical protein QFW77_16910 [Luteimonas sp. RD2P54]|uniref:Uncharacterized protein n=1 Tax=Luteimonas endophytica TaxID=3042023 RepID=A0ABT6JCW3_9GAMM|nr:hypothetical protein [Luteimonas endophytica]MDH5824654.1 hypothetical protein [Luteimonas endophytica]
MSNLVELVFENVLDARLNDFIGTLIEGSCVLSTDVSEADRDSLDWDGDVAKILNATPSTSATISLSLDRVDWPQISILRPLLQIIKYDGAYDVALSFIPEDISRKGCIGPIESLRLSAVEFLGLSGGENVYCGYEPAHDEKTRFFTNSSAGPIVDFW